MMNWKYVKRMEELSAEDLYKILKLRQDVFVIEQNCIYEDIDNLDQKSEHLLLESGNKLIAYSRIVPAGLKFATPSIGRIVVSPAHRGRGYGYRIVKKSIEIVRESGSKEVFIEAQEYLHDFYQQLGFEKISDPYDLDGIQHIEMKIKLER
jgi:ElaA protein